MPPALGKLPDFYKLNALVLRRIMQQHLNTFHTFMPLFTHLHINCRKCIKIFINTPGRSKQLTSIKLNYFIELLFIYLYIQR